VCSSDLRLIHPEEGTALTGSWAVIAARPVWRLEAVSQVSESDDEAGDMEKGVIHQQGAVVTHDQPAEIAQPGKGAFDFPTLAVAAQRPAILGGWFGSVAAVRAD